MPEEELTSFTVSDAYR